MKEKFLNSISSFLSSFALKLLTLILSVIVFFTLPLFLVISIPIFLIRFLVRGLAKYFQPGLGKMVTTRGSIFAADDLYNKPQCNVVVVVTVEGNVDMEKSAENASKTLLQAKFPNGDLKYPELKQYLTTWAGYSFWKDDETFDLKNHIRLHDLKGQRGIDGFTDDAVQEVRQEVVTRKWRKKQPLWGLTSIPNCYPKGAEDSGPHTTVLLCFHHSLGDGFSWLYLVIEGLCEQPINVALPNYFKREPFATFLYGITFPFRAAYNVAELIVISCTKLPFSVSSETQTGNFNVNLSDRIPVRKIKEVKSYFNVSFSSVVFAVLAGAIRDMLIKKRMVVPRTLPTITALPIPGHSIKLRNYMTGALTKLPTGEADPIARLKSSHRDYNHIKRSTTPILLVYMLMVPGSYFRWITKIVGQNFMSSTGLSNFPGGFEHMSYDGHKCIDAMFTAGLQGGITGLGFCGLSYVDGFRISAMANTAVLTKDEVKELTELIEKHIDILHRHVILDV